MNPSTLAKITAAAPYLCTATARQSEPYLDSHYRLSLQIFAALSDGQGRTCQEIADLIPPENRTGPNGNTTPAWTTINQILLALQKGGVQFIISSGNPTARTWTLPKGKATIYKEKRGD